MIRALSSGWFFEALQIHLYVIAVFGLYYRWRVRKLPAEERVGSLAFMPVALLMPITYALMTPLALFTLDSGSWETRAHEPEAEPMGEPIPESITSTGQHVLVPALAADQVRARTARGTGGHAQLPAA